MPKCKEKPVALQQKVIKFGVDGMTIRSIAKRLDMSRSTIHTILQKHRKMGSVENLEGRGCKRKTSNRTDRLIRKLAMKNRKVSASTIVTEVKNATSSEISTQTVRNRLNETGLHGRVPRKKPLISKRNKIKRLNFAREHLGKSEDF